MIFIMDMGSLASSICFKLISFSFFISCLVSNLFLIWLHWTCFRSCF